MSGVRVLIEDLACGTAGCVRDAVGTDPGDLILVASGSMVSSPSILSLVEAHRASDAMMTMVFNPSRTDLRACGQPAEIYLCAPEVLSHIPRAGYSDVKEGLIPAILRAGGVVHPIVLTQDAGNFHDRVSYLDALLGQFGNNGDLVAPDATIDPTARVYGPVAIAEEARILEDAVVVGPAVIGRGSVVGRGSVLVRSVVWEGVSIGDRCEIRESVVDSSVRVPYGAAVVAQEVTSGPVSHQALADGAGLCRAAMDRLNALCGGRMKHVGYALGAITILIALLWSYSSTMAELCQEWWINAESSAGLLVPFLAAYVVWLRRRHIGREGLRPAVVAGIIAFLLAQGVRGIGLYLTSASAERLSIILTVGSLVLLLGGWIVLKRSTSVLVFLCLMLPWPNAIQSQIGLPLQRSAATSAAFCLELAGYDVQRDGNVIRVGDASVDVAEACNGLRMITAFFVISGLAVLLTERTWWEKLVVLVSSVPIAIICNILRIVGIAIAYTLVKGDYGRKMLHDVEGYAMVPVALALVVGELWVLTRLTTPPEQIRPVVIARRKP